MRLNIELSSGEPLWISPGCLEIVKESRRRRAVSDASRLKETFLFDVTSM